MSSGPIPTPVLVVRCSVCRSRLGSQFGLDVDDDWMDQAWQRHAEKKHHEVA